MVFLCCGDGVFVVVLGYYCGIVGYVVVEDFVLVDYVVFVGGEVVVELIYELVL